MSNLGSPPNQRKQSNASGHPAELTEQATPRGTKREHDDDEDETGDEENPNKQEKRAGRRKIKIEYIEDKSRRHITFSKRKAGIMKKAYELSTLTGTQVLLLVVSETGLVYTFTTPKLQPLVTKPEGKNLIQACLNAPDTTPGQDTSTPTRSSQNPPVYGNDNSPPVDGSTENVYDADRKHQPPSGQMQQPPYTIGLNPYNQYGGIPNNMSMSAGGLAPPYMSTAQYPAQYNQQHLAGQYTQNPPYMQTAPTSYGWSQGSTNGNGNAKVQQQQQQFSNQSPEKK